jgi:hypothetical protein
MLSASRTQAEAVREDVAIPEERNPLKPAGSFW